VTITPELAAVVVACTTSFGAALGWSTGLGFAAGWWIFRRLESDALKVATLEANVASHDEEDDRRFGDIQREQEHQRRRIHGLAERLQEGMAGR